MPLSSARTFRRTRLTLGCSLAAVALLDAAIASDAGAAPKYPAHGARHAEKRSERRSATRREAHRATRGESRSERHAAHASHSRAAHLSARERAHERKLERAHERALARHGGRHLARGYRETAAAVDALTVPAVPVIPVIDLAASVPAGRAGFVPAAGVAPSVAAGADTLAGRSGKLRARFVLASAALTGAARSVASYFPYLRRFFGDSAARVQAGVYPTAPAAGRPALALITMRPFSDKVGGWLGGYNMGFWPGERSGRGGPAYGNPAGFIEVTAANQATYVSEHFRLADFLTHDQQDVWPKYLVLHEQLLDKLELVLDDLRAHGYQAERLHVMSGFRTPQYNRSGGDPRGRAEMSRHQYGDAADVWVDNGNGVMADLNGDGRVDARDAAIVAAAAERVEAGAPRTRRRGGDLQRQRGARAVRAHRHARAARPLGPRLTAVDRPPAEPNAPKPPSSPNAAKPGNAGPAPGAGRSGLTMFELARLDEARREAAAVQAGLRADAGAVPAAADAGAGGVAPAVRRALSRGLQGAALALVAVGAVIAFKPSLDATTASVAPRSLAPAPPAVVAGPRVDPADPAAVPVRVPARPAFGVSQAVYLRIAAPGQVIEYPVAPARPDADVAYQWTRAGDNSVATQALPLTGSVVVAPGQPGLYHLALSHGPARRLLDEVTLAVLTPFAEKLGGVLHGYQIGRYPFESFGGETPLGFVEVTAATARLPVSRHLRLEDFLTHDGQTGWPRYVAMKPQLLDKVELVIDEIARVRGVSDPLRIAVSVHSGFRTPIHNGGVEGSAFNSRHQYGDAADVAIDADGDGRFTAADAQLVRGAAELVEERHRELVGGLGLYTNVASPYVHMDVRGTRARWWRR